MTGEHAGAVDCVVVGGGVAGLAAAHALASAGHCVVLLEKDERVGGRVRTETVDGIPIDVGAQFVSDFYRATVRLASTLGISGALVRRSQRAYVFRESPRDIWPLPGLLRGHALSALSKLRLATVAVSLLAHWRVLDIENLAKSAGLDRQTAARYLRRTAGGEALDRFFGPLLRGLLYWEADSTSVAVVLSVLKAFATSGATYRFDGGIDQFATSLASASPVQVTTSADVRLVEPEVGGGFRVRFAVAGEQRAVRAASVVCAVPATVARHLVPALPGDLADFLASVSYSRTAIVTFKVPADAADYPPGAILFPTSAVADLASVNPFYEFIDSTEPTTSSAPDAFRALNVYLSDDGYEAYQHLSDGALADRVLGRITEVMNAPGWVAAAELMNVHRWPYALPRFDVGHIGRAARFTERQACVAGLVFAGDYLGGPYVDGAVRSGLAAAERARAYLERPGGREAERTGRRHGPASVH